MDYVLHIPAAAFWGALSTLTAAVAAWAWRTERRLARMLTVEHHEKICAESRASVEKKLDRIEALITTNDRESREHRERTTSSLHEVQVSVAVIKARIGAEEREP